MLLTETDKASMQSEISEVITEFCETAEIFRPIVADAGSFAGPHEPSEEFLGAVPLEFKPHTPEDLKQKGADGTADFPANIDLAEGDIIFYQGHRYRVTDVKRSNCFGAVTHLTASLKREYQDVQNP